MIFRNIIWKSNIAHSMLGGVAAAAIMFAQSANAAPACKSDASVLASSFQSADLANRFGSVPAPSKPLKVAYVTQLLDDPFWGEIMVGIKSETQRLGMTLSATAPQNRTSTSEQLDVAKAALATNPDILLLTAINATNLRSVIDEANARNIPTISINLRSEGVRVHIGTDHVALGAAGAEFLHEYFPGGAEVAQLEGEKTSPYRIDRVNGFTAGLKDYPNLVLVDSVSADWDDGKAYTATLQMMKAHPGIKGIYANSDLMAVGAVKALEEIGRIDDVAVVGTDGVTISKTSIMEGKMKGTAAQFPVKEGILGVQIGVRLLACQDIPGWVISPQAVMTGKSVGDYDVAAQ